MNFIVLTTQLLSNRIYRSSTPALYMTNLYFSNMLTVFTLPFLLLSNRGQMHSTPEGCKIIALTYYATCTAGFATLALISLNRYRVIHQRTRSGTGSKKRTYAILSVIWLTSLMCASPAALYATVLAHDTVGTTVHETCVMFFTYEQIKTVLATFKILICLVWGIMPVIIMTWFYLFFYKRLKLTSYRRRSHTLAFVSTLILSFLVLQTPFVGIMIFDSYAVIEWDVTCDSINSRDAVGMLARLVPNFHCMLNPVLYAFLGRDFNKRFMQCITGKLFSRRRMLRERAGIKVPPSTHHTNPLSKIGTLTRSSGQELKKAVTEQDLRQTA